MLPVRPLRAALLAFIGALALVEVASGLVAGQAWRLQSSGALSIAQRTNLHDMLENLRVLENVVVAGTLATTIVWALVALHNVVFPAHGGLPASITAGVAVVAGPVLLLVFRAAERDGGTGRLVMVGAQALALYLPFWALGRTADDIGGQKMPFFRWYLALAASFVVHDLFTVQLDLLDPKSSHDLGRTAMMFFINAVVVGVMGVMAAEATRSMDRSTVERALQHRMLHDDASHRTHPGSISMEHGATLPPPTPHSVPVTGPADLERQGGGVAVLAPPTLAAAPTAVATPAAPVLAPPTAAPVIAGPAGGAMPIPVLPAVTPPSLEPPRSVELPTVAPVATTAPVTVPVELPVETPVETPVVASEEVPVAALVQALAGMPLVDDEDAPVAGPASIPVIDVSEPSSEPSLVPPTSGRPLPPPPPGSRSSLPKLLTITEMRPIVRPEPEPEPESVEPDPEPADAAPAPGFGSMFQPLSPRQP